MAPVTRGAHVARGTHPTRANVDVDGRAIVVGRDTGDAGTPAVTPGPYTPLTILSGPTASNITTSSASITWTLSDVGTGYIEYGTTTAYGSETTRENSFNYSTHIQTISGLAAGTTYHYRVRSTSQDSIETVGDDATFATESAAPTVTYSNTYDLTGVTSSGGFTIDPTGVVDSTAGLNHWIAAQGNGTSALVRAKYVFPPTATYKITTGLCFGNKSYITVWGHAATSSAWIPANATSYQDPGCTISFGTVVGSNTRSAFMPGHLYTGSGTVSYGQRCTDIVIRGFKLNGHATTPGIFNGSAETVNAFEIGDVIGCEITLNKAWDVPGDFVRVRGNASVCDVVNIHHNYGTTMGRQGISVVEGDTIYFDDNVMDRCGYYGIDIEPDDDSTLAYRVVDRVYCRRNRFGSFGSSSVAGTFAAIGNGTHIHIADVTISDNVVTGSTYNVYNTGSQNQTLRTYIGQHITQTTTGADPRIQRLTFTNNSVTHASTQSAPVVYAGGVDTLVVTGNDSNLASGSFLSTSAVGSLYTAGCTSVTQNTNS